MRGLSTATSRGDAKGTQVFQGGVSVLICIPICDFGRCCQKHRMRYDSQTLRCSHDFFPKNFLQAGAMVIGGAFRLQGCIKSGKHGRRGWGEGIVGKGGSFGWQAGRTSYPWPCFCACQARRCCAYTGTHWGSRGKRCNSCPPSESSIYVWMLFNIRCLFVGCWFVIVLTFICHSL